MMRKLWRFRLAILLLLPSITFASQDINPQPEKTLTPITLQLLWKHQFEFAGFYAAVKKGFYRDVGLAVTLKEYQSGIDIVDEVVSGRAQYGINDASLTVARAKGSPVVLLSNIFQHSPMVLISKADSGIISPAQLIGKKVMLSSHELGSAAIVAMLEQESVTLDQLTIVEHTFNIDDFVAGKVDAMSAYTTNELGVLKEMGVAVNIMNPLNYGIDFYGNNIFTSENEIKKHPQRVKQFIQASLKGWEYALQHPEEIISLILDQYSQRKSRQALEFEANATRQMILPKYIDIGDMNMQRMQRIVDVYRDIGLITEDFLLNNFIYKGLDKSHKGPVFTDVEREWIREHKELVIGVDPNWAPFEYIDDKLKYSGMAADYLQIIEEKTGLKIKVQDNATWNDVINSAKSKKLDVLPAVMRSPQRDEFLDFTQPYIVYPMVILTERDARFISGLEDLRGEKVVVVKGYVTEDLLRENHPYIDVVVADNIDEAIEKVASGEAYAFVDNIATISRAVNKSGYTNLRVSGTTKYKFSLSLGVPKGNPILVSILDKTLDTISEEKINEIQGKWVSVTYAEGVNYQLALQVLLVALLIFVLILFWNWRLSQEVSQRKVVEEKLRESEQRFRMLFEENKAIEMIIDPIEGNIIEANNAAIAFYGYSHEQIRQMNIGQINTLSAEEVKHEIAAAKADSRTHFYFKHRLASGDVRDVEVHSGPVQWDNQEMLYSIIHDVTVEKRLQHELEEQTKNLTYQASHDALSGLVNRREFEVRLERAIEKRDDFNGICHCTVIFMDLDHFKIVNDTAGHAAGDEVLRKISHLLQSKVRERDTLARLGGDEFALLLENCTLDDAVTLALGIIQAVKEFQFIWEGASFRIGISLGITSVEPGMVTSDEVLSDADAACYAAKKRGRNCYHIFSQESEELLKRKGEMWWTNEIIRATEENRLVLYRQTIAPINKSFEQGAHYEILVRMLDEEGNIVLPGHFLPSAERYKLMPMIDTWVVRNLFAWFDNHPDDVESLHLCCINLSGHSIGDNEFTEFLVNTVRGSQVPADKICWEITETAAIANFDEAQSFISQIKALGCYFALDDFGSGLSSFNYLKHLEVDYLKIDGSFVKDMLEDSKDHLIVESIHQVGSGLKMQTIAEFVETQEILDQLQEIGVDYAQGYYLDKPSPLLRS